MPQQDVVDLRSMSDADLQSLFDLCHRRGYYEIAADVLCEVWTRGSKPPRSVLSAPAWVRRLPRLLWRQKPEGEGSG